MGIGGRVHAKKQRIALKAIVRYEVTKSKTSAAEQSPIYYRNIIRIH
jgi:hypothetical protein